MFRRSSSRFASTCIFVSSLATIVGCAHAPKGGKDDGDGACEPGAGDCAALRQQIRRLEARVRQLEDASGDTGAVASVRTSERDLPVVKLAPPVSNRPRSLTTLASGTNAAPTDDPEGYGYRPSPEPESPSLRDAGEGPASNTPVPASDGPGSSDDVPVARRFRLVGSRLVDLTKGSRASERRRRSPKGTKSAEDPVVQAYNRAMQVYRDGQHATAEASFAELARSHPNHAYADNALYWQGEAAYDQQHYADALAAFTDVVERYGGGNKAADALLKIGLCYGRLGDRANAFDVLTQLIAAYPRSNASRLAKKRLPDYSGAGD